jgi:hypothetical protein
MDLLDFTLILERQDAVQKINDFLCDFIQHQYDPLIKRGLYIYGASGIGKSYFVRSVLKQCGFDAITYNACDVRNKTFFNNLSNHHMSNTNIMDLFFGIHRPIAVVMDDIDGMNNGVKGGLNALMKLVRPKKTKKQRNEDITMNPIICIGNTCNDKKIKELMKVCHVIHLDPPKSYQILTILSTLFPHHVSYIHQLVPFIKGD